MVGSGDEAISAENTDCFAEFILSAAEGLAMTPGPSRYRSFVPQSLLFRSREERTIRIKQLRIIPDKCTGCMQCELACSFVQTGPFQPSRKDKP